MFLGANNPPFKPQVTSYDFGAPISENGILTAKYYAIKEAISEVSNTQLYIIFIFILFETSSFKNGEYEVNRRVWWMIVCHCDM